MPDALGGKLFPPHAYVPGQSARHPEDWFDEIKSNVKADIAPDRLHETEAFQAGMLFLQNGYFWECHEVLEAVWMQAPKATPEREMVQAIIQLANARLKVVMQRPRAATRLCEMVEAHLSRCPAEVPILGLFADDVAQWILEVRGLIASKDEI